MGTFRCAAAAAASIVTCVAMLACSSESKSPNTPTDIASVLVAGTPPAAGASSQFTAIAVHTDGTNEAVTAQATWRSSNTAVATVNARGIVTALADGAVEISATFANVRGALAFDVRPAPRLTVRGTVLDATSRDPVAAAMVTIKDGIGARLSATSDASGQYSVAGVAPGAIEISAQAANYVTTTRSITLSADATLDFSLARGAPCPMIGFDELQSPGAAFSTLARCGLTVTATTSNWTASTTYGKPAPFIQFVSPAGSTAVGELVVTASGAKFRFVSVDLYSSTTPIPYEITGASNSATVLSVQGTQGNTFGNFATIVNRQSETMLDSLVIRLTNPSAPCCSNPMGLDNIVVAF